MTDTSITRKLLAFRDTLRGAVELRRQFISRAMRTLPEGMRPLVRLGLRFGADPAFLWLRTADWWPKEAEEWRAGANEEEQDQGLVHAVLDEFPAEALARHVKEDLSIRDDEIEPLAKLHAIVSEDLSAFGLVFAARTFGTLVVAGLVAQLVPAGRHEPRNDLRHVPDHLVRADGYRLDHRHLV